MKKILAMLLAVVLVFGLVACSGTKTDGTKTDGGKTDGGNTAAGSQEYTITVWTPAGDQEEGNNWLDAMEKKFEEAHPEYKITWDNSTMDEGSAGNAVIADVTASADVFMFANDQMGSLINAGGLTKLVGDFETQVKNDNTEFMINSVTHTDDSVYAFPVTNNTWFLYYNKEVFNEEDVKSLDTMITKGKVCIPITTGWNAGCFFLGCGGTIFGETGRDVEAGINFSGEAGGYTAAKKMIELVANENIVAGGMDVDKLISGEVAAVFSGSWSYGGENGLHAALGDNLGIAMLPKFTADGQEYQMTAMSGSKCVGVNPNSGTVEGKQLVCTEFAAFLASEEAQLARYTMRSVIPAHKNLKENETIKNDPLAQAEIDTINLASALQSALPEMSNYWSPVESFGKSVANGEINMDNYEIAVDTNMEKLNNSGL